jgi:hypothetical protein
MAKAARIAGEFAEAFGWPSHSKRRKVSARYTTFTSSRSVADGLRNKHNVFMITMQEEILEKAESRDHSIRFEAKNRS